MNPKLTTLESVLCTELDISVNTRISSKEHHPLLDSGEERWREEESGVSLTHCRVKLQS